MSWCRWDCRRARAPARTHGPGRGKTPEPLERSWESSKGLVPCPYYFPNSFPMVLEFFRALDRASGLELVLYDNPIYTKTWLSADQLLVILDACQHLKSVKLT